jgi:hypothetical protein
LELIFDLLVKNYFQKGKIGKTKIFLDAKFIPYLNKGRGLLSRRDKRSKSTLSFEIKK